MGVCVHMDTLESLGGIPIVEVHLLGLTEQQQRFAQLVPRLGNLTEAARQAGYSDSFAGRASSVVADNERLQIAIALERAKILPTLAPEEPNSVAQLLWGIGLYGSPDTARVAAIKEYNRLKGFTTGGQGDGTRIGSITINYTAGDNLKEVKRAKSVASITSAVEEAVILAEDAGEPVGTAKNKR